MSSVADRVAAHFYENQIVPLLWSRGGKVALHAGAVVHDGHAIAFVGDSGLGKSTVATFLAMTGSALVTDDTLLLDRRGPDFMALPGAGKVRLWSDSGDSLLGAKANALAALSFTSKDQFDVRGLVPIAAEPTPLRRLYFLESKGVAKPAVTKISGGKALIACAASSFLLDWTDPEEREEHFNGIAALCNSVETYALDYPRSFEALPAVAGVILGADGA